MKDIFKNKTSVLELNPLKRIQIWKSDQVYIICHKVCCYPFFCVNNFAFRLVKFLDVDGQNSNIFYLFTLYKVK